MATTYQTLKSYFMRKLIFSFLLCISARLSAADQVEVKIGVILPLSGNTAIYGAEAMRAIEILKQPEYNSDPRYKFVYEIQDGACGIGNSSITAAQHLINKNVSGMIVGCSGEVLQIAPLVESKKIPVIAIRAGSPDVREAGEFVYRTYPDLTNGVNLLLNEVRASGHQKIAILTEINSFTSSIKKMLVGSNEKEKFVVDEEFLPDETNYLPILTKAKLKKPDLYYLNMANPTSYQNILKQMRQLGITVEILTYYMPKERSSLKNLGSLQEGVKFLDLPDTVNLTKDYQTFLNSYQNKFGAMPESSFSLSSSYDGIITLLTAIKAVGTDSQKIKDFLDQNEVELSQGKYRFDDHGDLIGMYFVMRKIKNGLVELVP